MRHEPEDEVVDYIRFYLILPPRPQTGGHLPIPGTGFSWKKKEGKWVEIFEFLDERVFCNYPKWQLAHNRMRGEMG